MSCIILQAQNPFASTIVGEPWPTGQFPSRPDSCADLGNGTAADFPLDRYMLNKKKTKKI